MMRLIVLVFLALAQLPALACEKNVNQAKDCWSPSSENVDEGLRRFYRISEEIDKALFVNDLNAATRLSQEYLTLAESYKKNWNYGNAIHNANVALGVVALRQGNVKNAGKYLVTASTSTGSPQLNTFGPDLTLADVLLEKGEKIAVLDYLKGIQKFWEMDRGNTKKWINDIENGKKPKLNRFTQ